jgi:6-phosphogluconolactonase
MFIESFPASFWESACRRLRLVLLAALAVGAAAARPSTAGDAPGAASTTKFRVYVGTYTRGESRGIYLLELSLPRGELVDRGLAAEIENPSFLAIHPNRRWLYAVGETSTFRGAAGGAVSALEIDAGTGKLALLNQQSSLGGAPCHIVVDPAGRHVLVANYTGGSVVALPIGDDGRLGEATAFVQHRGASVDPQRQRGPHAHSINLDAAGRFAVAADLGLDQLLVYRFDAQRGTLQPNDPPFATVAPGSGPRHFAFHPSGRYAYAINEMASTITAFSYDAQRGTLKELHTISTLPEGFSGRNTTAEVQVHPSGRFVYGSNRGHNSLAIFRVDEATGRLTAAGHQPSGGSTPRNFGIDPTGQYLLAANQESHNVVLFRIDPQSGALEPTGQQVKVPLPVCVKFVAVD